MIRICVLSLNRRSILMRCLNSIVPVLNEDTHLIALEQQCSDPIPDLGDYVHWTQIDTNLGCAGGRRWFVENTALQIGDIFVFLDDDLYAVNTTWLSALVAPVLTGIADISGVAGRKILPDFNTAEAHTEPDYVSGGWCAISARVFLGGVIFDLDYNPNFYEDVQLGVDAKRKGFRIVSVGDIGLIHETHPHNVQHLLKSRAVFIRKNSPIHHTES